MIVAPADPTSPSFDPNDWDWNNLAVSWGGSGTTPKLMVPSKVGVFHFTLLVKLITMRKYVAPYVTRKQWDHLLDKISRATAGNSAYLKMTVMMDAFKVGHASSTPRKLIVGDKHPTFGEVLDIDRMTETVHFDANGKPGGISLSMELLTSTQEALESVGLLRSEVSETVITPAPPTPDEAAQIVLSSIRDSDDPLASAGEWLTKLTNSITEVMKEVDDG